MVKIWLCGGTEYRWWFGTDSILVPFRDLRYVDFVQADGEELEYILQHSIDLPHTEGRVQIWTGDLAIFIVANIIGYSKKE